MATLNGTGIKIDIGKLTDDQLIELESRIFEAKARSRRIEEYKSSALHHLESACSALREIRCVLTTGFQINEATTLVQEADTLLKRVADIKVH